VPWEFCVRDCRMVNLRVDGLYENSDRYRFSDAGADLELLFQRGVIRASDETLRPSGVTSLTNCRARSAHDCHDRQANDPHRGP
jgi:hypothetical protein